MGSFATDIAKVGLFATDIAKVGLFATDIAQVGERTSVTFADKACTGQLVFKQHLFPVISYCSFDKLLGNTL